MPGVLAALAVALVGAAAALLGRVLLSSAGASFAVGRRLAGAAERGVGSLLDADSLPSRPVRLTGRPRCPDPIISERDERLVALHRDVEVRLPNGRWRTIERLRETRAFELWDHDGSLELDPAAAAEPLVAIPHVWRGSPDELTGRFRPAVERLVAEHGSLAEARATTRMVSVVDHLLVLAAARRGTAGAIELAPPSGGYVIATLELDAALRLLGGRSRPRLLAGAALVAVGLLIVAVGLVLGLIMLVDP